MTATGRNKQLITWKMRLKRNEGRTDQHTYFTDIQPVRLTNAGLRLKDFWADLSPIHPSPGLGSWSGPMTETSLQAALEANAG